MTVSKPKAPPRHRPEGFTEAETAQLAAIIDAAVKRAIAPAIRAELKESIGLRLDNDQYQIAAAADFQFVRRVRLWFESAASKIGGAVIMLVVGGVFSLLAYGAKGFFTK